MSHSIRLGRVFGVPIGLHFSWFIIAALITVSLVGHFQSNYPGWTTGIIWIAAIATSVLFFITLLAHEMSHALMARSRGLPIRSITLFALGGIAHIGKEANSASTEFLVAVVGPIASIVIGGICLVFANAAGWEAGAGGGGIAGAVLGWLGSINIALAIFNLIPGYPLDGGRLLRAMLWWRSGDADRATRSAARVGQFVAAMFIALGIFQFFSGAAGGGLWLALIGWFLLMAAQTSERQVTVTSLLRGVRVGELMGNDCATVAPRATVQDIVDDVWLRTARRCVIVEADGEMLGLVTPREVRTIDRARWPSTTAADVMRALPELHTVTPELSAAEALQTMAQHDVNQLPVVSNGRLAGMVSRGQLLQLIQSHQELKAGRSHA
jgi:Zn-dependent protease/CBS domain-containing protein